MASNEENVIEQLLDVERDAEQLISGSQIEASKRMASARSTADADYKKKYSVMEESLEKDFEERLSSAKQKYQSIFESYKSKLQQEKKDFDSFNALLESILYTA